MKKLGTGYGGGSSYCKCICSRFTSSRPGMNPYLTHFYCTRCEYWGNKDLLAGNNRCPCCNFRPRMKTWGSKKRRDERSEGKRI